MHIEIRSHHARLPRAHALGLAERIRITFAHLARHIVRVVVRIGEAAQADATTRECTVEVHHPNGQVTIVRERQRRLGALLRRATERAWKAAAAKVRVLASP
jgi:hypothetical protein